MARQIHYKRELVDLNLSTGLERSQLNTLLLASVPDKHVRVAESSGTRLIAEVTSWAGMRIGRFTIDLHHHADGTTKVRSSLVESVLTSSSWLPFVFGKGTPQALGAYKMSVQRVRQALR